MKPLPPRRPRGHTTDALDLRIAALVTACAFGSVAVAVLADLALRFGFYTWWHS